ncbi:hypothetical protein SGLAM104S_08353 [Streptomyces glaucescens]
MPVTSLLSWVVDDHSRTSITEGDASWTRGSRSPVRLVWNSREMKRQYEQGLSIRAIAEAHGRSYGFVHRVLTEAEAPLRNRGGDHRRLEKSGRTKG